MAGSHPRVVVGGSEVREFILSKQNRTSRWSRDLRSQKSQRTKLRVIRWTKLKPLERKSNTNTHTFTHILRHFISRLKESSANLLKLRCSLLDRMVGIGGWVALLETGLSDELVRGWISFQILSERGIEWDLKWERDAEMWDEERMWEEQMWEKIGA